MSHAKIYADFQNLDDLNRLRLTCAGTLRDLKHHDIQLQDGMVLTFYTDDADDQEQPDELRAKGIVHYNAVEDCWVAKIDWAALYHSSEEESSHAVEEDPLEPSLPNEQPPNPALPKKRNA